MNHARLDYCRSCYLWRKTDHPRHSYHVKNILGMIAGGYTLEKILQAYPELTQEMVEAALKYAATVIDEEQVLAHG